MNHSEAAQAALEEAEARGLNRGWDSANWADAYGGRVEGSHLDTEAVEVAREVYATDIAEEDYGLGPSLRGRFRTGYVTGYGRYFSGEWQNGEPRTDDTRDESWKQAELA